MEVIIIQANMCYSCKQPTDRVALSTTINGCPIAPADLSGGEATWTALTDGSTSSGPAVTHGSAASSLAQVLATGLVSVLKIGAARNVLCSLCANDDSG